MASTSTNKQPLMVDRPLHNVVDLAESTVTTGTDQTVDIIGTNSAQLLVDCTKNDGAVVKEIYALCRKKASPAYDVSLFFSNSNQFLTPTAAYCLGTFYAGGTLEVQLIDDLGQPVWETDELGNQITDGNGDPIPVFDDGAQEGEKVVWSSMPEVLSPVPGVGSEDPDTAVGTAFEALYVPKGLALWAAVIAQTTTDPVTLQTAADRALQAPLLGAQGGYY